MIPKKQENQKMMDQIPSSSNLITVKEKIIEK